MPCPCPVATILAVNQDRGGPSVPYRAPTGVVGIHALPATTRWIYLVLVVLTCLGLAGTFGAWTAAALSDHDEILLLAGAVVLVVTILLFFGLVLVGLYWLYRAWSWLPADQRYTPHWRGSIPPAQAALFLLIPYFHYYWMFVVSCGLCDALDRMRVTYPTSQPAPKGVAVAACICQLLMPLPVGGIMWFVFMTTIERLTREMSAASSIQLGSRPLPVA